MTIFYVFLGGESENGISFCPSRLDFVVPEVVIFDTNDTKWHKSYFLILRSQNSIIMTVMAISYVFGGGESNESISFDLLRLYFDISRMIICVIVCHMCANSHFQYSKI